MSQKKFDGFENVFVANSGHPDRVNERVIASGMDLKGFNDNPQIFFMHDGWFSNDVSSNIATGKAWVEGDQIMLGIKSYDEASERGAEVKRKVSEGFINAASIGFLEQKGSLNDDGVYDIEKAELVEVSLVNIPADGKALKVKSFDYNPEPTGTITTSSSTTAWVLETPPVLSEEEKAADEVKKRQLQNEIFILTEQEK